MLFSKIGGWIDRRLHVSDVITDVLYKPLSGGARYMFSLGFVNMFLFANQVLTGIFLMLYYVPSPDGAYDAVKFIQTEVTFGYIVRGMHFWGASLMVASLILHALRVFVFGAYKKPREVMWITGSLLMLLVFAFAFTGYLLPWDQKSYWATVVGTNVAGTAPFGQIVVRVLRGGAEVSGLTLTRFFTLHTVVLPMVLALVMGAHLLVLQLVDHTPPWDPEKAKVKAPFYPDQAFKDMVAALAVFASMIFLATVFMPHLEAIADPSDKTYNPRPEWYFFFLFQLLRYFEGPLEVVGTIVIPNLFILGMLLLPLIDRNPSRDPRHRPFAMTIGGLVIAGYLTLTVLAVLYPPGAISAGTVSKGRMLYSKLGCASCHSISGVGGKVGPPLDGVGGRRDRDWLIGHFREPQKLSPGSVMPGYDYLSKEELGQLTDYMLSLK